MDSPILPAVLQGPDYSLARDHLEHYYRDLLEPGSTSGYTGAWFDVREEDFDPNRISTDDLLALSYLSAPLKGDAVRALLHRDAEEITRSLQDISQEASIFDDGSDEEFEKAYSLQVVFQGIPGIGAVRSSKLMARMRPRLYPIYDQYASGHLGLHGLFALPMREWLKGNTEMEERLIALRNDAQLPEDISPLRILDVIVWTDADKKRRGIK